ncbi:isopenicillin N synthase family dioxygenase [Pseudomonas brassicacearum]|uniref:isopenicillin N synthase family dioxygenase n=1 Tax=Pseudomonas brassicacearum TaxID=930166 RepID=UPI001D48298D|nr:2-oxoglutarate and iron-dependent oxygenase domain-containing protein [Pseudomonas brassicacearum]CAH0168171.1 2-oxoglutarate-dependent ethylene/succinate-forming enzyme [Pseudomonas brassicacearum]
MIQVNDTRLVSKQTTFEEIPFIDIAPLLDGSDPRKVARQIGETCEKVGFFYIKNHGVSRALIDAMYAQTKGFFAMPFDKKNKLNVVNSGPTLRGYIPMYAENVDPENTRDFKECFDYGAHYDEVSPFFGANLMPTELPKFSDVCDAYHDAMLDLARQLISAIALSLDLPADYFEKLQRQTITIQRLLHYPSQSGEISQKEIGIGAHTDYGFLTILFQDKVGGLQVRNRAGEWVSAPPVEDTFIVNIGDLVQTLTNDRYTSTMHRVINTSGVERYSIPFFIDLDFDATVETVATCISVSNPAKYTPYTCGQHKYSRFVASYTHLQAVEAV